MLGIVVFFAGVLGGFLSAVLAAAAKIGDLQRSLARAREERDSWKSRSKDLERECGTENFVLRNKVLAVRAKLLRAVELLDERRVSK